ncbi:MOSC domain-containing protein [Cohnella suwonensis]|uniref:MOSC domain-containing protein n=1 Tax=Cohnella suwonensis TaxID=696072 RepID=A0ABW0LPC4_9BACL
MTTTLTEKSHAYPIISLNVGAVRTDEYKGKQAQSGIYKTTVDRPLALSALGLDGDEQADLVNHGGPDKAICVYSLEHYPHWEKVLSAELPLGAFGENFTVGNLSERDIRIGDVFRVGTAVVQVSQPRQPCWKLAMKWGLEELPMLVTETGATGFYFRVLTPGTIQPSDSLTLEIAHEAGVTIEEANRVMHKDKADAEGILRVLAVEELSASWKKTLSARLSRLENREAPDFK